MSSPFYKTPLEQLLQGSHSNRKLVDTHNLAIQHSIDIVKSKLPNKESASGICIDAITYELETLIKELQSLLK